MPPDSSADHLLFGPFRLSPRERLLSKDGAPVEIGGRSLDLLACLVEAQGRVLSKRELLARVWPDVVVEEGSLRFHMAGLRKILGDGEGGARYISTQVGVGYAFVAPVQRVPSSSAPAPAPAAPARACTGRLPAQLPHLIGREADLALLAARLEDSPLFTIVGPAGVGKTTLAIATGHAVLERFAGRAGFVDLAALEDGALVASAVAGALGITVQVEDPLNVILAHIRDQQLLLLLDNCEHLLDAVATLVERVQDAAPGVRIVATSREPLRVRGEHVHWLGPLDCPAETAGLSREALLAYPAVELFVERARAGNSALAIDDDAARTIAGMCRRLEGMALPIELAAMRAATHGLQSTAQGLGDRFSLAWTGRRTAQPRQQTLQATLDWSYDLLTEAERLTLDRLSVFLGPFPLDAALDIASDGVIGHEAAAAALDALTAKSLVAPARWGGESAYRLMEVTRAYARARLMARGQAEHRATARRHALHVLQRLEAAGFAGGNPADTVMPDLSHQLGNVRSALEWSFGPEGDLAIAVPLAAASAAVFLRLSLLVECRTWCSRACGQLQDAQRGTAGELELQAALGLCLMFTRGNHGAAEQALRRALEVATALDDRWNQLRLLGRLHIFHERIGDFDTALGWAETGMRVAQAIGDPEAIAAASSLCGISHHLAGDQALARSELELSLRTSLPSERNRTIYYGFDHRNRSGIALARALWLQGHADDARRVAERTLADAAKLEHPITHCIALLWTLTVYLWSGDLDRAEAVLETFATASELNGFGPYIAAAVGFRGKLAVQRGQAGEQELQWLKDSLAQLHAARYELLTTSFEIALVHGLGLNGRHEEALDLVSRTTERCRAVGELFSLPELLRIQAGVRQAIPGSDAAQIEALLADSLARSQSQGTRGWALRTAIQLARLRMQQGHAAEARQILEPVRLAFGEVQDTVDLQAADALLVALARPS